MKRGGNVKHVGLARAMSKLGYCSRSQASEMIRGGRVKLNGKTSRDPETPVQVGRDRIEVDCKIIGAEARTYLMLNKPRGVVTTASDERGRDTVYSCLSEGLPWVVPVGRLDKASEGLLLMTNDSEWGARITDPKTHLDKTYHVHVRAAVDALLLVAMTKGILTGDGDILRAKHARVLRAGQHNTWLEIVLDEGKNRQIRRILQHFEIEVLRLVRVAIGPLILGKLTKGNYRSLTSEEKSAMDRAIEYFS